MKKSSKFSDVLHVLLHMAGSETLVTSTTLAKAMRTNPVVIRRVMAGLRKRGFVRSEKGHGGGWALSCNLKNVTLFDVYEAIGAPTLLAIGNRTETPMCLVEKAVNTAMGDAFNEAEDILVAKFRTTTLADVQNSMKKHSHHHCENLRQG